MTVLREVRFDGSIWNVRTVTQILEGLRRENPLARIWLDLKYVPGRPGFVAILSEPICVLPIRGAA